MATTAWNRIEAARERWNVLRHPFYVRWSAGELSADELAAYTGQYRHAVQAIATMSETVAEALPERPELAEHARAERDHVALVGRVPRCGGWQPRRRGDSRDQGLCGGLGRRR